MHLYSSVQVPFLIGKPKLGDEEQRHNTAKREAGRGAAKLVLGVVHSATAHAKPLSP